jgi:DNA-binding CsgD family transcriptional regulator
MAARRNPGVRADKLVDFLEVAYDMALDDQRWLRALMEATLAVWGAGAEAHGAIYDASDVSDFQVKTADFIGLSDEAVDCIMEALPLFTPPFVTRTFRALLANSQHEMGLPELVGMIDGMTALGRVGSLGLNGLDPSGKGVFIGMWSREPVTHTVAEMALLRRIAHHIGAAHRCRRRLRASQPERPAPDPTVGAEAILDRRGRVVHAEGEAQAKAAQADLLATATARERARTAKPTTDDGLREWPPLTRARWTLVDSFEQGGARYVVARENQSRLGGLETLTDRERQAIAYLACGQSTKETAYALGIADATVRVLLARAAAKLGVRSRADLLAHEDVRSVSPDGKRPR